MAHGGGTQSPLWSQLGGPGLLGQEGKQFLHQKIQTGGLFPGTSTTWKPLNVTCDKPMEYGANVLSV